MKVREFDNKLCIYTAHAHADAWDFDLVVSRSLMQRKPNNKFHILLTQVHTY